MPQEDKRDEISIPDEIEKKSMGRGGQFTRAALDGLANHIPFLGGLLSAASTMWSEENQRELHQFLVTWMRMMEAEVREKQNVLGEIVARLDMHDEEIGKRIQSDEYQHLLRKAFRNWSGTESESKQTMLRNILSNAAASRLSSDRVVELFIDWLHTYSEFHFAVIADLYGNPAATRGDMWNRIGTGDVREDSADADLFKLLFRDLSTGGIIRQHRDTDYQGNFVKRPPTRAPSRGQSRAHKSAFDESESYELTALGLEFVHYAVNELTTKLEYKPGAANAG